MYDGSSTYYNEHSGNEEYRLTESADTLEMVIKIIEAGLLDDPGKYGINPQRSKRGAQQAFWAILIKAEKSCSGNIDYCQFKL